MKWMDVERVKPGLVFDYELHKNCAWFDTSRVFCHRAELSLCFNLRKGLRYVEALSKYIFTDTRSLIFTKRVRVSKAARFHHLLAIHFNFSGHLLTGFLPGAVSCSVVGSLLVNVEMITMTQICNYVCAFIFLPEHQCTDAFCFYF